MRTFVPASSLAYCTVTAFRYVFDGEYASEIGPFSAAGSLCRAREPTPLDMFTIRGDAERRSSGSIAFVTRMGPYTFVPTAGNLDAVRTAVETNVYGPIRVTNAM